MLSAHQLTKSFGSRRVLAGLDLSVQPGGVTLMIGANGAGKTTALRLFAGLAEPDSGSITIGGHDLSRDRPAALAQLSFLPQAPRFHPRLTVRQVAEFYAKLRGCDWRAANAALETWGLTDFERTPTAKLSGGLRQRLALAIFDLADTPVRLLDEPGLSLDPEWREHLQAFLLDEARRGCTVLVATHLLGEWEDRITRCILIENGRCAGELPPHRLREAFFGIGPAAPTTAVPFAA
jgi:ABC-2 type transport system ATP-binding protein